MPIFAYLRGMFQHFLRSKRPAVATISFLSLAGLLGCASTGSPGGGLYDETPPFLVRSEPGEGAVQVSKQKIVMRFNENIKLDNANEKLTISPPQEKTPSILSNAKTLTIELQDTLKPDVTYTIDLGDAVQDNNEGNPMENLTLTFSTGDHIDTMKVKGTVLNAADLEPVAGAFVGIYRVANADSSATMPDKVIYQSCLNNKGQKDSLQLAIDSIVTLWPDSIFSLRPFERAGKTDSKGRFTISGVAPGYYRVFALKDGNTNYKYDTFDEDIAFLDSLITPSVGHHTAYDTIWNRFDSTRVDSIFVHEVTDYYPNDLCLRLSNEGRVNRYLDDVKWKDSVTITMLFAAKQPEPPVVTLLHSSLRGPAAIDKDSWMICEPNPTNDTLTYWLRDTLLYTRDSLSLCIAYPFTVDGIDVSRCDTIHLERPVVQPTDDKKAGDDKGGDKKKRKRKAKKDDEVEADTVPPLPVTVFMTAQLLEKKLEIGGRPHIEVSGPLDSLDLSGIHLEQQKDSVWKSLDFELEQDSLRLRRYTLHAKPHFSPGLTYRLVIDSAAMHDVWGHPIDSTAFTFSEKTPEEYAHLLFNVQGAEGPAFMQLVNEKDKPVMQVPVKNGQAKFTNIAAGKYYARLVEDRNDNGKFDAGWLPEHRQPEKVYYFSTLLELRENWQFSQTWNIHALDATQQKPEELIQNKPKERQKKKSKNEEYLKEHPELRRHLAR